MHNAVHDRFCSKAHMEQVLAQAKVKITPASKVWDAQRAYEKRLTTISKDKGIHPPPSEDVLSMLTSCQRSPQPKAEEANGRTLRPVAGLKRWRPNRSIH